MNSWVYCIAFRREGSDEVIVATVFHPSGEDPLCMQNLKDANLLEPGLQISASSIFPSLQEAREHYESRLEGRPFKLGPELD